MILRISTYFVVVLLKCTYMLKTDICDEFIYANLNLIYFNVYLVSAFSLELDNN